MGNLLQGKCALVLGIANKWSLAYAIAEAFKREGACLFLTYQGERQRDAVESCAAELGAARVLACDVGKDHELDALAETLKAEPGRLDAVVHSIAFANREDLTRPFLETSRAGYQLAQDISAYSLVGVARAVAPLMSSGGSITTLTYLGSLRVIPNYNVMGVAKAALEASVRYLAYDFGPQGVRVNAISAGPIRTLAASGVEGFKTMYRHFTNLAPLQQNVTSEDIGNTAVFLSSDLASKITGEVLFVDSGYNIMGLPIPPSG
jgi:enoyl-[acyl-carrier protein] reductase I